MSALPKLAAALGLSIAWAAPAQAMYYYLHPDTKHLVIEAGGTVETGDSDRFLTLLKTLPPDQHKLLGRKGNLIIFDSSGGLVAEALAIAKLVEKYGFATDVRTGGQCSSSCVLAWAVGKPKSVPEDTCIGVHNANVVALVKMPAALDELDKQVRQDIESTANLSMATWLREHGAPRIVTTKIFHTPASGVYCLTADDLEAWKVTP